MKNIKLAMLLCASLFAAQATLSYAADAAKAEKATKPLTCKQEAKKAGISDKKELAAFVKQCKQERKQAKKKSDKK